MTQLWALLPAAILGLALIAPAGSAPPDYSTIIEQARRSVFVVKGRNIDGPVTGSAFVVGRDRLLTAWHVVEGTYDLVAFQPELGTDRAAPVGRDTVNDLAILYASTFGQRPLPLGNSERVRLGEEVLVLGYPLGAALGGYSLTVTRGIVSAIRGYPKRIQVDAAMNPGVSGGPVVNTKGEVIGVAVASVEGAQATNFAVPINAATAAFPLDIQRSTPPQQSLPILTLPPEVRWPNNPFNPYAVGTWPRQVPSAQRLVAPGKAIGTVRLGMSVAEISRILGKPPDVAPRPGTGLFWKLEDYLWYLEPAKFHALRGVRPAIRVGHEPDSTRATRIGTTALEYRTRRGLGVGHRIVEFRRELGRTTNGWEFFPHKWQAFAVGAVVWFHIPTGMVVEVAVEWRDRRR